MPSVPLPASAHPAWLTAALRADRALPRGEVTSVTVRDNPAFNSRVRHLALGYSADAPIAAPRALLLKTLSGGDGEHEVGWYRYLAERRITRPMLPACHLAIADSASGESALLLADLSASHGPPVERAALRVTIACVSLERCPTALYTPPHATLQLGGPMVPVLG